MLGFARAVDAVNTRIGRWVAWLIVLAILISTLNAVIRKLFDTSSNAWLELQWILFGVVFLLCAPWTLLANEHIRIDIVNSRFSKRTRDWIDVIGHVFFLFPTCLIVIYTGLPFFLSSYNINEQSMNAGGLPQWPAKFLVPLAFTMLLIQGISELIKRIAIMRGAMVDPHAKGGHHGAAEAEAQRLLEALEEEARVKAAAAAKQLSSKS
jgi:TRAP-type mannitol/chloroaromatic compound transport system permease small subunit